MSGPDISFYILSEWTLGRIQSIVQLTALSFTHLCSPTRSSEIVFKNLNAFKEVIHHLNQVHLALLYHYRNHTALYMGPMTHLIYVYKLSQEFYHANK